MKSDNGCIRITDNHDSDNLDIKLIIMFQGRIEDQKAEKLKILMSNIVTHKPAHLILDLTEVTHISSLGLSTIIDTVKGSKAGGFSFSLCGVQGKVKEMLEISGLSKILTIIEEHHHSSDTNNDNVSVPG